jgi:predicted RND superfamily exporter protein
MPIKVIFAIAILIGLLGVMLYYAPFSVLILVFGFSVAWAIHTVLYYFAEKSERVE